MKNNKRFTRYLLISFLLILLFMVISIIGFLRTEPINKRFFTDISDFNKLEKYEKNERSLPADKNLKGITPETAYTKEIEYKGKTYKVYAYVFSDTESSVSYFCKKTGKIKSACDYDFSISTNYFFSSHFIAYNECCLYRVDGGNYKSFAEVVNFINESFPLDLRVLQERQAN